jgi:hypothetical protein
MTVVGQQRQINDVRATSAWPSTPDVLLPCREPTFGAIREQMQRCNLVRLNSIGSAVSRGSFDPRINFAAKCREVDWLGQKRLGAAL